MTLEWQVTEFPSEPNFFPERALWQKGVPDSTLKITWKLMKIQRCLAGLLFSGSTVKWSTSTTKLDTTSEKAARHMIQQRHGKSKAMPWLACDPGSQGGPPSNRMSGSAINNAFALESISETLNRGWLLAASDLNDSMILGASLWDLPKPCRLVSLRTSLQPQQLFLGPPPRLLVLLLVRRPLVSEYPHPWKTSN